VPALVDQGAAPVVCGSGARNQPDQVSAFLRIGCPLSAGFSVRFRPYYTSERTGGRHVHLQGALLQRAPTSPPGRGGRHQGAVRGQRPVLGLRQPAGYRLRPGPSCPPSCPITPTRTRRRPPRPPGPGASLWRSAPSTPRPWPGTWPWRSSSTSYPNEWEAGHVEGAIHIPLDDIFDRLGRARLRPSGGHHVPQRGGGQGPGRRGS